MNQNKLDRRNFLKVLGLGGAGAALAGCDLPSYVTLEEGEENVVSYLAPDEYVIPGVGVWYASTCLQCSAGCGIHGRVREGRVLKLEGNPSSTINSGRLCQMGQAALQSHFNPDRISDPLVRKNGQLVKTTWDEALGLVREKSKSGNGAWVTGTISGHQRVMVETHLGALGGNSKHYAVEQINAHVWQRACTDIIGDGNPELKLDKAGVIFSLGADFMGTFVSPVHFAANYGEFRSPPRGVLIMAEPAMSLTGANADHWVGLKPGSEAALALGVAHVLIANHGKSNSGLSANMKTLIQKHDPATVERASGVSAKRVEKIAASLANAGTSIVLAGGTATAGNNGYLAAASALVLNKILGNIGVTILPGRKLAYPQLGVRFGNRADLKSFADDANAGNIDVVFVSNVNPLFLAPNSLAMSDGWDKIGFKVVLSTMLDETTAKADVVLPLASTLEDWGSHVPGYNPGTQVLALQQPLMEPVFKNTRGFGDLVMGFATDAGAAGLDEYDDYYGYLRSAISALKKSSSEKDWNSFLMAGSTPIPSLGGSLTYDDSSAAMDIIDINATDDDGSLTLIASPRMGMWDGRNANLPWLQEAPDQISKVVWDSWAELHPKTATRLGVKDGDYVSIKANGGTITTRVFVYKGIHPGAIAVPIGRGHSALGRYAENNGVNPLAILDGATQPETGELTTDTTVVDVVAAGNSKPLATLMEVDRQYGRKLAASISAKQLRRTEGGV